MARLLAEKLYDYLDVAERKMEEGHLWLAREVLGALEDIAVEEGIGLPQRYFSLMDEYYPRAADKLLEEYLSSVSKP